MEDLKYKKNRYVKGKQYLRTHFGHIGTKGEKHIPKGESGPIVSVPFKDADENKSILILSFGRFKLDNLEDGFRPYETLHRLRMYFAGYLYWTCIWRRQ